MKEFLATLGMLLIVAARFYQIAAHPEWTEAQALLFLGPVYAISVTLCGPLLYFSIRNRQT